jgi:hypothetical protein
MSKKSVPQTAKGTVEWTILTVFFQEI